MLEIAGAPSPVLDVLEEPLSLKGAERPQGWSVLTLTRFHAFKQEMTTPVQTWLYFHRTQRGGFSRNNVEAAKERTTPQWPPLVCWNPPFFAAH